MAQTELHKYTVAEKLNKMDVDLITVTPTIETSTIDANDVLSVTDGTVTITFPDDVNIGSEVNCYCAVDGQWIVTGHITYDAVGSIPTIA